MTVKMSADQVIFAATHREFFTVIYYNYFSNVYMSRDYGERELCSSNSLHAEFSKTLLVDRSI